ncbi:DISARM system helicase DrmA [Paenibacillus apiarius]|nr:DISARM system helicase DrmA [Paenibacillus apiarius]
MGDEIMALSNKLEIRNELINRMKLELIGPNLVTEELNESPTQRYLTGILWPIGSEIEKEDDEEHATEEDGEESGLADRAAPLMQAMKPSAIGLSFVLDEGVESLNLKVSWGQYEQKGDRKNPAWHRKSIQFESPIAILPADEKRRAMPTDDPEVFIEWMSRPLNDGFGRHAISLFLVNRKPKQEKRAKDVFCLFQPEISVNGAEGERPFSIRKMSIKQKTKYPDVAADELLYRNQTVFAVGHGVAVGWEDVSENRKTAGKLKTIIMPIHEIPRVVPPDWKGDGSLDMTKLANASDGEEVYEYLNPLLEAYDQWIWDREDEIEFLDGEFKTTAKEHTDSCRESLNRMKKGLDMIRADGENGKVLDAFCFANRAMALQRTYSEWARVAGKNKDWSGGPQKIKTEWRPFQIGFILQSLTGIVEPSHGERQIADLIWFPTGGGKTEAYLGLAAFVMALRRLNGEVDGLRGDAGVAVLMRYTLRLLTIQQFQRAATLICACENIRKENPNKWGGEPFRIGLWVGQKNTPNDFDECEEVLESKTYNPSASTPVQLVSCPWCGAELTRKNYFAYRKKRRVLIGCSRADCEFHRSKNPEGIPAVVSDEEIYRLLPTLIIGTVDKFARMPWVGNTQSLMGNVKGQACHWGFVSEGLDNETGGWMKAVFQSNSSTGEIVDGRPLLPPDLIIQDELHLISGPLGTMVGVYETAIDYLAGREIGDKRIGPKVVASTATIRRAKEQILSLFARRVAIFPSPGLLAGNSFFSEEQPLENVPGRSYVGIFAPGRSMKTALVRVYAALLSATEAMEKDMEDLDSYRTLVGYFNSLRELGGAVRLIEDDVKARIKVLSKRTKGQIYGYKTRVIKENVPELTSRVDSSAIPSLLQRLEQPFYVKDDKIAPVDVVLASNMISVGVDVSRLGLMVVTGQPKTTAEYIQATSRVGRSNPGLVFTVYNWARPRDVSHYERFDSYHDALYRYVEAISVTPFSSRARDRALSATLVMMSRLNIPGLSKKDDAKKFKPAHPLVARLKDHVRKRVESIEPLKAKEVAKHLDSHIEQWQLKTMEKSLVYSNATKKPNLMFPLGEKSKGAVFGVPSSMRDVEKTIGIYLKE